MKQNLLSGISSKKLSLIFKTKILVVLLLLTGLTSFAHFSGAYAPANWAYSANQPGGDGSVNTSGAPYSIILSGSDNGGGSTDFDDYTITVPATGFISFTYNHADPDIDYASYVVNGVVTDLTSSGDGNGTIYNVAVNMGETFAFRVNSQDNCCGRGVLTITNFSFTATSCPVLTVTASSTDITCNGLTNGTATVSSVSGGATPYTYSWVSGGQTTSSLTGLSAATYTCTIRDNDNCPAEYITSIAEPTLLTSNTSQNSILCFGDATGIATVGPSGGTTPYSYSWSPTTGTTSSISNLTANTYTCTIKDANNCSITRTVNLTQPLQITASSTSQTDIVCRGAATGVATVVPTGGIGSYTYTWSGNASASTTGTATGLAAGSYTCIVKDNNLCSNSFAFTITEPALLSSTSSLNNVSCFGNATGSAFMNPSGGTTPYTYSWTGSAATTSPATGLVAGSYTCTVTDACSATTSKTFTITQPAAALTASPAQTNVLCFGNTTGAASVGGVGGTSPYAYSWSTGVTNNNSIAGLTAGGYTCTITDANNCTTSQTFSITQPAAALNATPTATNIACFGTNTGSIALSTSGGTTPYSYSWSNTQTGATATGLIAGTYTATITDANSCSISGSLTLTEPAAALSATTSSSNVICFGGATGSASVSVSGGTTPYVYSWTSAAGSNASATGLIAGTYTCTITDANSCTLTKSITITQPSKITITPSQTNVSCNTGTNGSASVSVSGGITGYSYSWSTPNGSGTLATGLVAGSYTLTVTDANLCTASNVFTITEPTVLSASTSQVNVLCFGNSTGSATATGTGGTAPYTYAWGNGQSAATATGLISGSYSVIITDNNSCSTTRAFTLTQPAAALSATTSSTNILCFGNNTGVASVSVSGGTTAYSYVWSPSGGSAATASNLTSGNYTVNVTDANSCTISKSYTLTQPAAALATSITSQTDIDCNGNNNGAATISVSGGTSGYSYSWSTPNGSGTSASNLVAGTYTCTVTDANGCTKSQTIVITQPATLAASTAQSNIGCFGENSGSASVSTSGGITPYTYNWTSGNTTAVVTGLPANSYTCTITDAHACSITRTFTLTQPFALTLSVSSQTDITCFGASTGAATAAASGGALGYSYSWNNNTLNKTTTGLSVGVYTCTVTDFNGCTATVTANITQPSALSATTSQTNVSCFGNASGSATVTAANGTSAYTYLWSPSGGTNATASNLTSGSYTVVVTDACSASLSKTFSITQPAAALAATSTQTNVLCFGNSTGAAGVSASGGTSPYAYSWSPAGGTAASASNLASGAYVCTITDANACTTSKTFSITQPAAALSATTSQTNVLCFGNSTGSASLSVAGGTTPYAYSWTNAQSASTATGLAAGSFTCTVTDANGCTLSKSFTITQPGSALAATTTPTNISCFGNSTGAISVSASGGTTAYSYSWSTPNGSGTSASGLTSGTYTVTITDANACTISKTVALTQPAAALSATTSQTNVSCNGGTNGTASIVVSGGTSAYSYSWSPTGGSASIASNLSAGSYVCVVTDANACTISKSYSISQPVTLTLSTTKVDVKCFGNNTGTATAIPAGGTTPYAYSWSAGAQTTATATGLTSGTYTVFVVDANNCSTGTSVTLSQPAAALAASTSSQNILCNGNSTGIASVSVSGGTTGYSYSWTPSGGTGSLASGLLAGTYTCTITDANSCSLTKSFSLTQPSLLAVTTSQTNISCNGLINGAASVSASGGVTPYTYSWTPTSGSGTSINSLGVGTYSCTVTDANGCSNTKSVSITQPAVLSASTAQSNVACFAGNTGVGIVTPTGGTTPYNYSWSPNTNSTATASGLAANTYTCSIADANGCSITRTITITQPLALVASLTAQTNLDCFGANTGSATVSVTGGALGYSYSWSPLGGSAATGSGLTAGTYTCHVTDFNGCTTTASASITQPTSIAATTSSTNVTLCFGNANGSAAVSGTTGGTSPYSYSWTPAGGTLASATGLIAGAYTCTITDSKSCTLTKAFNISQPTQLTVSSSQNNITCFGGANGSASVSASGGTTGYTYSWTGVTSSASSVNGLTAGSYTCTVKDANNCTATKVVVITQPANGLSATTTQTNIACLGVSSWSATVNVTGGTTAYSYSWSPSGGSTATASGFIAGVYTVSIADANNCSITKTVSITEPTAIAVVSTTTNVNCNGGNNGSASLAVSGGISPYSYSWTSGLGTSSSVSNLTAGNYSCTVTDANGCTSVKGIVITSPAAIAATVTQTNVSCNGGSNGSIGLSVTGGSTPYAYSWSPAGGSNATANGLSIGLYTCVITDAKGCTYSSVNFMNQPAALSATMTSNAALCKGTATGSASIAATGGNTPYTYSWTSGAGSNSTASNLAYGTYTCNVTDAKGCSTTRVALITEPTLVAVSTTSAPQEPACGNSTGSISVAASGGTSGYTYVWSQGGVTDETITGLAAGNYTVVATDANGCTGSLVVPLSNVNGPSVAGTVTDAGCVGQTNGSVDVTISAGTSPFTYSWSNGETTEDISGLAEGTYALQVIDANTCVGTGSFNVAAIALPVATTSTVDVKCNGGSDGMAMVSVNGNPTNYTYSWSNSATDATISGLTAGSYTCTITDLTNCSSSVVVIVNEPSLLSASNSVTDVNCNGNNSGAATVNVSGGTIPYTYSWSSGSVNANEINLVAGSYTCTITDGNGCTITNVATIAEPLALTSSNIAGDVSCNGGSNGSASVNVNGGTTPYTYSWSNGGTDAIILGLVAGNYGCTITDANGCSVDETITINEPSALVYSSSSKDASCNGSATGSASITVSGGLTPYTYSWSPSGGSDADATGLIAGSYTVDVMDANGCSLSQSYTIAEPALLTSTASSTDALCNGGTTGTAMVTAAGGTTPYAYSWTVAGESNDNVSGLAAGTYTCTIMDMNNCSTSNVVTIAEPTAVMVTLTASTAPACGMSDGSLTVSATGGTGTTYTYSWTPAGGTDSIASGIPAGNYQVTVADANGCTGTLTTALVNPNLPVIAGTTTGAGCAGSSNGTVTVNVSGGTTAYAYSWDNGATTQDLTNVAAGTYTITVTDAATCVSSQSFTVTEFALPVVTLSLTGKDTVCTYTGNVTLGGGSPASGAFSGTGVTGSLFDTQAGVLGFNVINYTYTDSNGCANTAKDSIYVDPCVGINSIEVSAKKFNVYPNPSSGVFTVDLTDFNNASVTITIVNVIGEQVLKVQTTNAKTDLNISDVGSGVYSITIESNGYRTAKQLVINK